MTRKKRNLSSAKPGIRGAGGESGKKIKLVVGIVIVVLALSAAYLLLFANSSQSPTQVTQTDRVTADSSIASLPVAPRVGARAPDFTLANMNGDQVSLNEFQGQPVIVSFFHTW